MVLFLHHSCTGSPPNGVLSRIFISTVPSPRTHRVSYSRRVPARISSNSLSISLVIHQRRGLEDLGKTLPVSMFSIDLISFLDSRTGRLSNDFPVLRKLCLVWVRDHHIPFARSLIAYAVRPTFELVINPFPLQPPDLDAWHIFDTVLFALCCKSHGRISIAIDSQLGYPFPLTTCVPRR